jgi:predicted component of type VI protein secretion system
VLGAADGREMLLPYAHDQLWPCFDLATRRIKELLTELTTGPVGDIILRHDGEYFSASIEAQFFSADNRYYLAIKSDLSPTQLFRLLQETGKITTLEEMPRLQNSMLFGLKIEVLELWRPLLEVMV